MYAMKGRRAIGRDRLYPENCVRDNLGLVVSRKEKVHDCESAGCVMGSVVLQA